MATDNLNLTTISSANETIGTHFPSAYNANMETIDAAVGDNTSDISALDTRLTTAEGEIDTAQGDISSLNSRATRVDLTVTAGTNVTLGTNKACIVDGFIYLSVKGKANAAITNAVVATISGDTNFISPTTIPIGIGGEWNITSAGYGFINGKSLTATVPSGSWFHLVATIPYA